MAPWSPGAPVARATSVVVVVSALVGGDVNVTVPGAATVMATSTSPET